MKTLAAVALALLVFGGLALAQTYPSRARISGGSGSTVTAPATGAGTDTCTGSGCAIGAVGISTDGGIKITGASNSLQFFNASFPLVYDPAGSYYTAYSAGALTNSATVGSNVGSGLIAFQSLTGAKTCLGTSGTRCLANATTTKGAITLSAGTGTATVESGATCVCTDSTATAAVKCAVASTTLTATGTGTDVIAYFCF